MNLKVYADRLSQPSRAVIIFCKVNAIDFEEVSIRLAKGEHRSPKFKEINPMEQVPAIVDGRFRLFESHAIMRYIACAFPRVPGYWYPADLFSRAKIDSILDWHHSNLRLGATTFLMSTVPAFGRTSNLKTAAEAEALLSSSLSNIESIWLKGDARFLLGNQSPSIADLSLVCEIMQFELLLDEDRSRVLGPHRKIMQWVENVRGATNPHFEEIHDVIYKVKAKLQSRRSTVDNQPSKL